MVLLQTFSVDWVHKDSDRLVLSLWKFGLPSPTRGIFITSHECSLGGQTSQIQKLIQPLWTCYLKKRLLTQRGTDQGSGVKGHGDIILWMEYVMNTWRFWHLWRTPPLCVRVQTSERLGHFCCCLSLLLFENIIFYSLIQTNGENVHLLKSFSYFECFWWVSWLCMNSDLL